MARLKLSTKKKPASDQKEDVSSPRGKRGGQNKSYSEDAEDEGSPKRNARRKAASKGTGQNSFRRKLLGGLERR
jgi:hypothetical protein